jgi:hypothetical protein
MSGPISDKEFGRRLSAARGYSPQGRSQKGFADFIEMDRGKLARYEAGRLPPLSRSGITELFEEKTGLPGAFFSIDFKELPAMARVWRQVSEEDRQDAIAAEDAVAKAARAEERSGSDDAQPGE